MGNSSSKQTETSSSQSPSVVRRGEVYVSASASASSVRPLRQESSGAKARDSEPAVTTVDKETLSPEQQAIDSVIKKLNAEENLYQTRVLMSECLKEFKENIKRLLDFRDQLNCIENLPSELQASVNLLEAACRVAENTHKELKTLSDMANDLFERHQRVICGSLKAEELKLAEIGMRTLQKMLFSNEKKLTVGLQHCKERIQEFEHHFDSAIGSLDRIKEELQWDRKKSIAKGSLAAAGLLLGGAVFVGAAIFVLKQGDMKFMENAPGALASVPIRCGKFLISSMSNAIGDFRDAQAKLKSVRKYQELMDQRDSWNFETEKGCFDMIKKVRDGASTCCEQVLESIKNEEERFLLKKQNDDMIAEIKRLQALVDQLSEEKEQPVQTQQQQEEQQK